MEMEMKQHPGFAKQVAEEVPSLLNIISSNQVAGFDSIQQNQHQQTGSHFYSSSVRETETSLGHGCNDAPQLKNCGSVPSISISMPTTLTGQNPQTPKKNQVKPTTEAPNPSVTSETVNTTQTKFYPQPIPRSATHNGSYNPESRFRTARDHTFDSFKTWSGRLERQLSNFRGKPVEPEAEHESHAEIEALPVDRYFDALQGPELDTLRPSEELMLPEDKKWPFLLRFQISSFGICLGVSSQAMMWKNLATTSSTHFLHISPKVNLVLWYISIALVVTVSSIYALKLLFYFEAVRREYYHPVRANFFFAPFIALLFLAIGVPPSVTKTLPHALWYVLMAPFLILELKIYGQWMSGGQRRLSKVANPSNHLSIVGNFVGALLGASMGLKEGPLFFFAVGLAHYTVLFVTLYQRLPTNDTLPKELHPVFFLFVAAPSVVALAWAKLQGSFDYGARISYFIALFLYFSLVVRVNFFRGFRFSLAWWAYTFPMTGAAISTIIYSNEVTNWVTRSLTIILCGVAVLVVTGLLVTTLLHAFVFCNLFPNDIAIAISDRPAKPRKRWYHLRTGILDTKDIENYLKFASPDDGKDLESSVQTTSSIDTLDGNKERV